MRRTMVVGAVILAIVAMIGIGVAAFNVGVHQGVTHELAQSGSADQVVRVVGPGYGWYGYGRGFGFPFGLILFPLFIIGIVLLVRGAFARGRWGGPRWGPGGWGPGGWGPGGPGGPGGYGPHGPWGGPAAFDEYHRRLHEPQATAGPDDAPAGGGTRETPAGPGIA
jgi:hypothetical protein